MSGGPSSSPDVGFPDVSPYLLKIGEIIRGYS